MPIITLPDGKQLTFDNPVSGMDVATTIGTGLAKAAACITVNGKDQDLSTLICEDATISIGTLKNASGLDAARHTLTAQVLARAVKELYPHIKLAIGPTIEHGFYYDIDFSDKPLSADDLPKIEKRMREIIKEANTVEREELPVADVKEIFKNEPYKLEIIADVESKNQLLPGGKVSIYRQKQKNGQEFIDLCVGPHVPHFGLLPEFKLTVLAGAYWRGDASKAQLTRIYGVAFATKQEVESHLTMLEEAKKRDHRKLGRELDLYHLQDEAPGQVFWHPKGWSIYLELQNYIRRTLDASGYNEINTPQRVHNSLYVKSGHWDKFGTENMFLVKETNEETGAENIFAMKPMNCPCHVQVFNSDNRSYRDLPLRLAEFGSCMRNEAHGALHGLMRVTTMTQDDAHIFCTHNQIQSESVAFCELLAKVYKTFGFNDYFVKLSTRPEQRVGSDDMWDKAEEALEKACDECGLNWTINPGEGAFYGPKLEFVLRDSIGRDWQCGTLQVDFNLPVRLGAEYDAEDGTKQTCVMLHRAILGSLERFTGILVESYAAKFPTWLSPTQCVVIPITDKQADYAHKVAEQLKNSGIKTATGGLRVQVDTSNERMQKKILIAQQQKVPYMLVVGGKEEEAGTVAVRLRDGTDLGAQSMDWLLERLNQEVSSRTDTPSEAKAQAA